MSKRVSGTNKTDEELVELIQAGDVELFAQIIDRYQAKLIAYVRRIVYSQQAAEDVTQETFIKSYKNLQGFKTNKKFSSWIYRIAHNEAVNYIRKNQHEITVSDDAWFDTKPSQLKDVEAELDRKISSQSLAAALRELPRKYSEPITLHAIEGNSYEEISDILRIPKATVGTRINRGKVKLKASLTKKGGRDG